MKKLAFRIRGKMMDYSMNDIEEDNYIFGKQSLGPISRSIYLNGKRRTDKQIISGISKKTNETKRVESSFWGGDGGKFQQGNAKKLKKNIQQLAT